MPSSAICSRSLSWVWRHWRGTKRCRAGKTVVALVLRVSPGQNDHTARRADRLLAVGCFKPQAGCRKGVELRNQSLRMPIAAHAVRVELVGKVRDHIRFRQCVDRCHSDREISMMICCGSDVTSVTTDHGTAGWHCLRFFPLPQGHGSLRPAVFHRSFCSLRARMPMICAGATRRRSSSPMVFMYGSAWLKKRL